MATVLEQQQAFESIQSLYTNYKKDGPSRKTSTYLTTKLQSLEQQWQDFEQRHSTIIEKEDGDIPYFKENVFQKTKTMYEDMKMDIINLLASVAISTAHQAASTSKPAPNTQPDIKQSPNINLSPDTKLSQLLSQQETSMKALEKTLEKINSAPTLEKWDLEDYLSNIKAKWNNIEKRHWELDNLWTSPNEEYETKYSNAETVYEETKRSLNKLLWESIHQEKTTPRIEIPEFSGNPNMWISFKNLFTEVIHSSSAIPKCQKMKHLKSKLRGEAEKLVQHLHVSAENYDSCWEILNHRYDNKRQLFNSYMNTLTALPNILQPNYFNIKKMHDAIKECLNGLNNLGLQTSNWEPVIVYLMSQKLDSATFGDYTRDLQNPRELPNFKEFIDFLENKFITLNAQRSRQKTEQTQQQKHTTTSENKNNFNKNIQQAGHKKHQSTSYHTSFRTCPLCEKQHVLMMCDKFLEMDVKKRAETVTKLQLCKNCLFSHGKICKSANTCKICSKSHHSLLHINSGSSAGNELAQMGNSNAKQHKSNHVSDNDNEVLLTTAQIQVKAADNTYHTMRVLLDQGSEISLITENAAQLLGLPRKRITAVVSGVGESSSNCKAVTLLKCKSIHSDYSFETEALIMKKVINSLPSNSFQKENWPHLENLKLADPDYNISQKIDILMGVKVYSEILLDGVLRGNQQAPIAQQTRLGWVLCGNIKTFKCHMTLIETEELTRFWETEDITQDSDSTTDYCENFYQQTTVRRDDGKYVVQMPLKPDYAEKLGKSRARAITQFNQLEKRFTKNPILEKMYKDFIQEYIDLGHMKPSTHHEIQNFLPHHGVLREKSTTTKLRVVFNASMKTDTSYSLNDLMEKETNLLNDMQLILIRWRLHKIVFCADIEKMYRCILLAEKQQPLQKIIWRNTPTDPIQEMQLCTLSYGVRCAPYIAVKTIRRLALDDGDKYPEAAKVLHEESFVDDVVSGANTLENALNLQHQLIELLKGGGFNLRKWSSNTPELLKNLSKEQISTKTLNFKQGDTMTTLGIAWNPETDEFMFNWELPQQPSKLTKRILLSEISKLYDPLGWISPVTVSAKLLFQKVWMEKTNWEEEPSDEIKNEWMKIRTELPYLKQTKIERWIGSTSDVIEIHAFCDSSEKAFCTVAYSRVINNSGQTKITLIAAKTRVVPLNKKLSLPRLELMGALLLSKLIQKIVDAFKNKTITIIAWCDSKVTLAWIQGDPNRWERFIKNRVQQITAVIPKEQWNYVKSDQNPADAGSRGLLPSKLIKHQLWWHGPTWLTTWKQENIERSSYSTDMGQEKHYETKAITQTQENLLEVLINKYSSFTTLQRIVAWILRFINKTRKHSNLNIQQQNNIKGIYHLNNEEIWAANKLLLKHVQRKEFADEIHSLTKNEYVSKRSKIYKLSPFLDKNGLLRVGGRLENSNLTYEMKKPIILPNKSPYTRLVISNAHLYTLHGGARLTLSFIRQRYWIISGNRTVKEHLQRCVRCHRFSTRDNHQIMGNLPEPRVTPSRPFSRTGCDYTGFVDIKINKGRGVRTCKAYIAIFICMATKGVQIELCSDLTAQTFVNALKRLCARRGTPSHIYSDNASYFTLAAKLLKRDELNKHKATYTQELFDQTKELEIQWHFNAPIWPTAGGIWEAAVRSMKHHLRRVLGTQKLTYEELATLLQIIEASMNSRPLCQISEDAEEFYNYLTPGHFLTGGPILTLPEAHHNNEENLNIRDRWQLVEKMGQQFWKKWSEDYLTQLQKRSKWQKATKNLNLGEVVLIKEDNLPPYKWALGRVIELHPGDDGYVRVTTLKTVKGTLKRPITRLAPLPITPEGETITLENEEQQENQKRQTKPKQRTCMSTILNILYLALTMFSLMNGVCGENANYSQVQINPLTRNQAIYYDKIGSLQLAHNEWILLVYYNLTNYWTTARNLENYVEHLNSTCASMEEVLCKSTTEQLDHEIKMFHEYNSMLLTHQTHLSSRKKRGLINGVGYVANSLFGILDQKFADKYEKDIEKIHTNENHLMELMKNQTSIVEIENNMLKKNEERMISQYRLIETYMNTTKGSLLNITNALQAISSLNYFSSASLTASLLINNLKSTQGMLMEALTDLHHGKVGIHLFTPTFMIKLLTDVSARLPKTLSLPINNIEDEIKDIYKLLYIRGRITENFFLFEMHLPLTSNENYNIYKVIPIPIQNNEETVIAHTSSQLIAINIKLNTYISMQYEDLRSCLLRKHMTYICSMNQPIHNIEGKNLPCEAKLISHRPTSPCNLTPITCKNKWYELHATNSWLSICCGNCTLRIICKDKVMTKITNSSSIITLAQGCQLQESETTIYAHNTFNNSATWSNDISIPTNFEKSSINDVIRESILNTPTLLTHYPNLTNIDNVNKKLKDLKQQENFQYDISNHDIHEYVVSYSALGAIVLAAIIYVCRRWGPRTRSQPRHEDIALRTTRIVREQPVIDAHNVAFVFDDTCRTKCKAEEVRPGTCPSTDNPKWVKSCVQACNADHQCDGVQKCCFYGCSSHCSDPIDLISVSGLPALPVVSEAKEKGRAVVVKWSDGVGDNARATPERILYILQEQHHLGPRYDETKLGPWNLVMRTNRTKVSLKKQMKPGRWYRFRVAAVSSAGTRGYSDPSPPFTARRGPRPPPSPKKLRVTPLRSDDGNVAVRLEWKEPKSDVPVVKYKVFWSRRVRGLGGELDSVLVNHQTVSKDQTYYDIKDLLPNSMYFLQVQTISEYGSGRLRSDKAAIFYNTTLSDTELNKHRKIKNLKLRKIIWNNKKIRARISWDHITSARDKPRMYFIHWETMSCEDNKGFNVKNDLAASTKETIFELYELHYNCKYLVHVNKSRRSKIPDSELIIKVPGCEYFQNRANNTNINCNT